MHEFDVASAQLIRSPIERVWTHVTDVDVTAYPHPPIFKLLGVPRPLHAELRGEGVGAQRIAWFDNGKRFVQQVLEWNPPSRFRFSFTADPGFRAGYLLDLASGPFRMLEGWYELSDSEPGTVRLTLGSRYFCSIPAVFIVPEIVRAVLLAYQRFLLRTIQANCEAAK